MPWRCAPRTSTAAGAGDRPSSTPTSAASLPIFTEAKVPFVGPFTGAESLRDVVAWPKTQKGTDLMTGAPGDADGKQLRELYVKSTAEGK